MWSKFFSINRFLKHSKEKPPEKKAQENQIFKSNEYSNLLLKEGVIQIPFLDEIALQKIKLLYSSSHDNGHPKSFFEGIHMTIWDNDTQYKLSIREGLEKILTPYFESVFKDYRAISQQFIVKLPGKKTTFPVHQDWSIVNENNYFSLNIWIPLEDVDEYNGAMWIVKGSHILKQPIRGAGSLFPNYFQFLDDLKPYITSFSMKAGEALIFYHSTIHGSPPNSSESPRITIQTSVIPKTAPLEIYFQPPGQNFIEVHHPQDNFNFYYENIREDSAVKAPTDSYSDIISNYKQKKISINAIKKIQNSR
jgi:hypothetical protein